MKMVRISVSAVIILIGISVGVGIIIANNKMPKMIIGPGGGISIDNSTIEPLNKSSGGWGGYNYTIGPNGTVIKGTINESNMPHLDNISNKTSHYVDYWNATPSPNATLITPDIVSTPSATAQHGSRQIPGFNVGLAIVMILLVSCLMRKKRGR